MTHFLGMDDVSEVHYAREIALNAMKRLSMECGETIQQLLSHVAALIDAVDELAAPYIMCFCDHENLLSQWRDYGCQR